MSSGNQWLKVSCKQISYSRQKSCKNTPLPRQISTDVWNIVCVGVKDNWYFTKYFSAVFLPCKFWFTGQRNQSESAARNLSRNLGNTSKCFAVETGMNRQQTLGYRALMWFYRLSLPMRWIASLIGLPPFVAFGRVEEKYFRGVLL